MYFTPRGIWLTFGIALGAGSVVYFIGAAAFRGSLIPWACGVAAALTITFTIIVWLKMIYIRIGMDSSKTDYDDPELLRLRMRDGSRLKQREGCECSIILWEGEPSAGVDVAAIQVFTGFSGFSHASVDCCLYDETGRHYMIESTVKEDAGTPTRELDGPQYAPIASYRNRRFHREPVNELIDCKAFCDCLRKQVANPDVHHKTARHFISLLFGLDEDNLVTCSGLVARCIQKQPNSRLNRKLDSALDKRLVGGEISPSDLARAFGIDEANLRLSSGPPR